MEITSRQVYLNSIINNKSSMKSNTVKNFDYNKNYLYTSCPVSKLHYPSNYNNKIAFKGISFDFVRDNISFFENEEIRDILYKNKKHQMNRAEDYKPENLVSLCKGAETKSDLAYLIGASGQEEDFNNKLINGLSLLSYSLYENKIEDYKEYAEKLMGYIPRDVKISTDQMLALFAFDVNDENDLKSYIDLIKKYPDLSGLEMILIRRMQLDDNAINTYINNIRNKSGLYKEEAVKCAKLGLTDAQIDRFIEIKNKKINDPDMDKSIPQRHCPDDLKHIKYPVNRALKWAQEGKTDDEIEKEYKTIKLILKGYDIDIIPKLINLNDSELAVYDEYIKKGASYYDALEVCRLSEEERKIYDDYREKGESPDDAIKISKLSNKERNIYDDYREKGEESYYALKVCRLSDEKRKIYDEYIKKGEKSYCALDLCQLSEEERKIYDEYREKGVSPDDALELCKLSEDERKICDEYREKGVSHDVALDLCQLSEDERKIYDEYREKGEKSYCALDLCQLSEEERKIYDDYREKGESSYCALKVCKLSDEKRKIYDEYIKKGESYYYALDLCQLSEEERKIYDDYREKGESSYCALDLCQLSEDELTRYDILRSQKLKRKDGSFYSLSHSEAYVLVKETTLSLLPADQIKELPEKVFYLISTGEAKDIHTAIQKAVSDYIKAEMLDNINGKSFAGLNFRNISKPSANGEISVYDTEELEIKKIDNGIHVLKNGENNFEVNIKKKKENGKNVLYIEDKNSNEQFSAYNGAISIVDKTKPSKDLLDENTIKSFVSTPNLNPEKQAEILAKTAQNFVFNIIDDKNETIIGQGLNSCGELGKPFYCQGKSDDEIINHYGKLITELKQNNQLTAENILRIFPKDARLTIKPYSCGDDNKILYCIGAEWTNNNGKNWEMRIHSPQLNYTSNSDWIFRLGYQNPEKGNITFFEFNNTPQGYDFNGGFNEGKSHIHIPSPIRSNLLNNIDFQYIIKQISQKTAQENVTYETDTDKFMADYINNKDIVEKLRKENGLLPL